MQDQETFPKKDFVHPLQDRQFLEATFLKNYFSFVGKDGTLGRRYAFGPLCLEYYTTDMIPEIEPFKGLRLMIWSRVTRKDIPKFWKMFPFSAPQVAYAYIDIKEKEYQKKWSRTFKYYYNAWLGQEAYEIVETSYEVFAHNYSSGEIAKNYGSAALARTKRHFLFQQEVTHFYILENKKSKEIVSGISVVDSKIADQSYYISAFTKRDKAPKQAGLWLLNHWMEASSERNLSYANLGFMWTEGSPKSWKGFSEFKAKFNPFLLKMPPELYRLTFSWRGR